VTTVKVQTIGLLKSLFGRGELDVTVPPGGTVDDVLAALVQTYGEALAQHVAKPADPSGHPPLRIMVNGRDIEVLGGRGTVLAEGDVLLVLTPIAGG
jgi:molybdopterin converting factor small subunit